MNRLSVGEPKPRPINRKTTLMLLTLIATYDITC